MIEWLAFPLVVAGAAFIPKKDMKDKDKIKKIFEVGKIGVKKGDEIKYPKLIKQIDHNEYTTYLYSLPLGIPSKLIEMMTPVLEDGLNKKVEYEFEGGYAKVNVYETELPKRWDYDSNLLRPGTWEIPVGKNHQGILYHDFDKYQHLLNGGVTRFGKTVFMKEMFHTLLMNNPNDVEFYILDLKGGLEFYKYSSLQQVKVVACDINQAALVLKYLRGQVEKREEEFRHKGITNIVDTPIKKRTFVIVDEGAELSPKMVLKEHIPAANVCQNSLSYIARIGGGLGYRLVYATQYPTKEAVPMQVKMNIVARLSFICAEQTASQVILDQKGAEELPAIPGRAIYKIEKMRTVQVPYIDDKMMLQMMEENKSVIINPKPNRNDVGNDQSPWHRKD
jgi:S-DNA-T family DNA segregation ATPase FtsK/SpoIIIE